MEFYSYIVKKKILIFYLSDYYNNESPRDV